MRDARLPSISYMSFPFRIGKTGALTSNRAAHIREQIEQILFTTPGERVYRPEFGAGVRHLLFEPNNDVLSALLLRRLQAALEPALRGEVDPQSLEIDVASDPNHGERLNVKISYTLAAIGHRDELIARLDTSL